MPMSTVTLGETNAPPRLGPVLITELMVSPMDIPDDVDPDALTYLELHNSGETGVEIEGWELSEGIDLVLDAITLPPGGTLLVLPFDPTVPGNAPKTADFRAHYGLPVSTPLAGGVGGTLSANGDTLRLWRRTESGHLRLEDTVSYDAADLSGLESHDALHRQSDDLAGPESWVPAPASPGEPFTAP